MTTEGLLFHEGRIRRIYLTDHNVQTSKIFPMLVEEQLMQTASVKGCVVVGRQKKNSATYETVAFVIAQETFVDELQLRDELAMLCQEQVPSYMQPVEYRFVDHFPHTLIGKVDFRTLEEQAREDR